MHLSQADHSTSPPRVDIPRDYNAAHDLLERNAGRAGKVAFIDAASGATLTYGQLAEQSHRFANALRARGFQPESRVLLAMLDTPEWPVVFLGCILAGVVPVAANTLLTAKDFEFMLRDSRAQALFVSKALLPTFDGIVGKVPSLKACSSPAANGPTRWPAWWPRAAERRVHGTCDDDPASGSIPAAPPARPRARCTCIRTWCRRPSCMAAPCWASARTTSSTPRPSCSSPTAWATPSPSR
jgi:benzoate-CoA ligase